MMLTQTVTAIRIETTRPKRESAGSGAPERSGEAGFHSRKLNSFTRFECNQRHSVRVRE